MCVRASRWERQGAGEQGNLSLRRCLWRRWTNLLDLPGAGGGALLPVLATVSEPHSWVPVAPGLSLGLRVALSSLVPGQGQGSEWLLIAN